MESHASANRIQCSERSALILAEQAPEIMLLKRGKVAIKGKGEMVTYWIGEDAKEKSLPDGHNSGRKVVSFETYSIDSSVGGIENGILRKKGVDSTCSA